MMSTFRIWEVKPSRSRATKVIAEKGFYVRIARVHAIVNSIDTVRRNSGTGLILQHGTPLDESSEVPSTQVSWPRAVSSTVCFMP